MSLGQTVVADSSKLLMRKNSLNLSIGPGGIFRFYLPVAAYYERLVQNNFLGPKIAMTFDVGGGLETHWAGGGPFYMARFGILTGMKKSHLEAKVGAVYFDDLGGLKPAFCLGYRGQLYNSHFTFRTGVGWPEAIYVGWGVAF